jgi:CDGSH-type Zn-finger protein
MDENQTGQNIKVTVVKNGPARVECDQAEIIMPSGEKIIKEQIVLLCRCSCSKRQPFCDGTHKAFKFEK